MNEVVEEKKPLDAPNTGVAEKKEEVVAQVEGGDKKVETPPQPEVDNQPKWAVKRIDKLSAEKKELETKFQEAQTKLAEAQAQLAAVNAKKPGTAAKPESAATNPAEVAKLADQIAAQKLFNQKCNEVYNRGEKNITGFTTALKNLQAGLGPQGMMSLVSAAFEFDNPEHLLFDVASDIDKAQDLVQMSAVKLGRELSTREAKLSEKLKVKVSKAPPPPATEIVGESSAPAGSLYDTKSLSTKEWVKQREKELAEKRKRK